MPVRLLVATRRRFAAALLAATRRRFAAALQRGLGLFAVLLLACSARGAGPSGTAQAPAAAQPSPRFVSPYGYEWFVRAELASARGDHAQAAEAYRMAISSSDDDAYLLARLAEAAQAAGDRNGADAALDEAFAVDAQSEAAWLAKASIARARGELPAAIEAYERAEVLAPAQSDAPLALAELLHQEGHPERAIAVLERAAARGPSHARAALRARIELASARDDGAALAAAAADWLAYAGGDEAVLRKTAAALMAAGKPLLAQRMLDVLPERNQDVRLRLSVALALGRAERVELLLETAPPDALGGPLSVADAYVRIHHPQRALDALQQQAAAADADPHQRLLLAALARLQLGQRAAAATLLARIPPGSAYRKRALEALAASLRASDLAQVAEEVLRLTATAP